MLPEIIHENGAEKIQIRQFDGILHRIAAENGAIWDDMNIVCDDYPILRTRKAEHRIMNKFSGRNGAIQFGPNTSDLITIKMNTMFYKDFSFTFHVSELQTITPFNQYAILMPGKRWVRLDVEGAVDDYSVPPPEGAEVGKVYYLNGSTSTCKKWDGTAWQDEEPIYGNIEASTTRSCTFEDGTYAGEPADANTIRASSSTYDWSAIFSVGDSVTISGAVDAENNQTLIVREIDGRDLRFYENSFVKNATSATITVKRAMPDMDWVFVHENRLWGCKGKTIYASKLGDFKNWNNFDGISTDSFSADVPTLGDFTCGISFQGYPTFFKENGIFKVYGSRPSNYEIKSTAVQGCVNGKTLALSNETLFYLSNLGVMQYNGGIPVPISDPLGDYITGSKDAIGFSDGYKYYLRYRGENTGRVFAWDQRRGMWHVERHEERYVKYVFQYNNRLAEVSVDYLDYDESVENSLWAVRSSGTLETIPFYVEFARFDLNTFASKYPVRLWLRYDAGNDVTLDIAYDGGDWETAATLPASEMITKYVPVPIRRCDSFRLKISGTGDFALYALQIETRAEQTNRKGG